ncbi:MAG: YceI family protein [Candidatus Eisenbacteria bacterium]
MRQRIRVVVVAAVLLGLAGPASAAEFVVRPGGDSKVVFTSKAPTESFDGKTSLMTGTLSLDPGAVGDSITVHLEVDLASLDTGSKLRNKHMRENHLETDKFPRAVFDGATVRSGAGAKLESGKAAAFQVEGTFSIHGVSRRLVCEAQAMLAPKGNAIVFSASFPITLSDYDIKRPEFLFMKLAETQQVKVSATASSQP